MTHRERFMKTIRGEPTDFIPYIPRLDIWYNANSRTGTLPDKYKHATLLELTDDLGLGYHSIVPQFRDFEDEDEGGADIGLGLYRFRALPFTVEFRGVERRIAKHPNGLTETEYITPYGTIKNGVRYDERMKRDGATISVTLEHAVKGPEDYEAAAYIFENAEVKPNYGYFKYYKDEIVRNRGVTVACAAIYCSPMHFLLKELMPVYTFFIELNDNPGELEAFADRLSGYCGKIFDMAGGSPADIILSGANYDSAITTPAIFSKYIAPELKRQADALHSKGKYLATHADGDNNGLLRFYPESGVDIADSICPAPMTKNTLKEVRESFGGKVSVWGGIPSIAVLENSMSEYEFDKYLDMTMESIGKGDHIIFSIADTTPPGAKFERILKIDKKVKEFGPVVI